MPKLELLAVALGVFGIVFIVLYLTIIRFKVKANRLGIKLTWGQLFLQKIRKTMNDDLLDAAGLAVKEGLEIDITQLELHQLSGGNPGKVVKGIADNRRKGIKITYQQAIALDLAEREITKEEIDRLYGGA